MTSDNALFGRGVARGRERERESESKRDVYGDG